MDLIPSKTIQVGIGAKVFHLPNPAALPDNHPAKGQLQLQVALIQQQQNLGAMIQSLVMAVDHLASTTFLDAATPEQRQALADVKENARAIAEALQKQNGGEADGDEADADGDEADAERAECAS